jgi:rSAM/selenodomain-associated transferase 2
VTEGFVDSLQKLPILLINHDYGLSLIEKRKGYWHDTMLKPVAKHDVEARQMTKDMQERENYKFSIIIPVFNEASRINAFIDDLRNFQDRKDFEIIVVDSEEGGETINAIRDKSVITLTSPMGRAKQMNEGTRHASGEILVFLHADTRLPENGLDKIEEVLDNGKIVGGAFDLGIESENILIKLIAARTRVRCRLSRVPYGDQAIFLRRDYFERIGMYSEQPFLEDVELMRRIRRAGDKIHILKDRVMTSARRWETEGIFYTTLRNHLVVAFYRFGVSPERLVKYYKSGYKKKMRAGKEE